MVLPRDFYTNSMFDVLCVFVLSLLLLQDSGLSYSGVFGNVRDNAFRLIADHCRMVTKAMSQGILPDHRNAG